LAFIPPTLDQVLVGSIERSRHPDLKAVFLIGATQKQFPVPISYSGILTDDDRAATEAADFALAATAGQTLAERQYLTYIAFTRPSEFMCVTYPLADDKGSVEVRSQFISSLESLFDNLNEESVADEQNDGLLERVYSKAELADLLCSELGKDQQFPISNFRMPIEDIKCFGELLDNICSDEQLAEVGSTVAGAINYDNRAHLDEGVVEKLFGWQIKSSATRLSTFAACPYKYFAEHILKLEERKESKLKPLDIGRFYHSVLDSLLKRLNAEKKDFATINDKELLELLSEQ
jgi:ATP-dependent helicase/nuclease subunit B